MPLEDDTPKSLEVRVALLEQAYKNIHIDFRELRSTITSTAMTVAGTFILLLMGMVGYFGQQKDQAITDIKQTLRHELSKQGGSNE
jgi:hypothetical protein